MNGTDVQLLARLRNNPWDAADAAGEAADRIQQLLDENEYLKQRISRGYTVTED